MHRPFTYGNQSNLLSVLIHSTTAELDAGHRYYQAQLNNIREVGINACRDSVLPKPRQLAAAFAALSPNNSEWMTYRALDICLRITCGKLLATAKVPAYSRNKEKALRLLRPHSITASRTSTIYSVLSGQKVRSFWHNTVDPEDTNFVTIDGHAYNAWAVGANRRAHLVTAIPGMKSIPHLSPGKYQQISDAYREVGTKLGIRPNQVQSTVWLTWRRLVDVQTASQQRLFDFHEMFL